MAHRSSSVAPLFLRLALGIVFIWVGLGKVTQEMEVQGQSAATLATMGVDAVRNRAAGAGNIPLDPPQRRTEPTPAPAEPLAPGTDSPESTTPATPTTPDNPAPRDPTSPPPPSEPLPEPASTDPTTSPRAPLLMALQSDTPATPDAAPAPTDRTYSAADFPEPIKVHSLYGIALLLHKSAHPATLEDGTTPMPLVPDMEGRWYVYLAWAAAITELVGGVLILVGLFGRVAALGLAFTMLTAIWLTQVGPAIQIGDTLLGFLPNHGAYEKNAAGDFMYTKLAWQFTLMCAALAVLFAGSGALSLDRLIFPGKHRGPRDSD